MSPPRILVLVVAILSIAAAGLAAFFLPTPQRAKIGWKAEDYFKDPAVVALCNAIAEDDVAEIDRLVAAGADANARGKDNMTPLLWAFLSAETTFKRVLEHGADPNVIFTSDFGTRSRMPWGESVIGLSASFKSPNRLKLALQHGGNPNVVNLKNGETPIFVAILVGRTEHIQLLIDAGADLNHQGQSRNTPLLHAAAGGAYLYVLTFLDAGADYRLLGLASNDLVLAVARRDTKYMGEMQLADYRKVVAFLEGKGADFDAARRELAIRAKESKERFIDGNHRSLHEGPWAQRAASPAWWPTPAKPAP